jgi:membrane-associated HD superfamily phosphohydrolase
VMLADAAESASRTLEEPTATSISRLVHDLMMRRLLDGQFDESDVTMRQLELIERALVKALTGIYHGRIAYPSSEAPAQAKRPPESETASGMVA